MSWIIVLISLILLLLFPTYKDGKIYYGFGEGTNRKNLKIK